MYLIYLHFKVTVDGCKIGCLSKKIFLHALLKKNWKYGGLLWSEF